LNSALLPKEAVKAEFARRLQQAFTAKGWTQSELARQAENKLPKGHEFGRYNVSTYVRGKSLPGPVHLKALCDALGLKPEDLLPSRGVRQAGSDVPALDVRDMADGNVWLRINQAVPWPTALKIMELLKG
jgi:transcriptional regulator with XRE-family HTH domain